MSKAERNMVAEVERISSMLGLPEIAVARMLDSEAREAVAEDARREAERQAAIERGQDAVWAHQHANLELGLPAGTSMAERLALMNPLSDEPSRDRRAPYGSASNPAFLLSTPDGPVDIGYQAQQAQRSFGQEHDDALAARARELAADPFMRLEVARLKSRRVREARRGAEAAQRPAERRETGTGEPELTRTTADAFI